MTDNFIKKLILDGSIPDGSYLSRLPVVKSLKNTDIEFRKPVTFFVGENGIGKSTLIEAIAVSAGFNPEGGTVNFNNSSQFIISTHSPVLTAYPNSETYEITENGIEPVPYNETEHYRITKEFINNPDKILRELLEKNET